MKHHTAIILSGSAWFIGCGGALVALVMAARQPETTSQLQAWREGQTERFTRPWQLIDEVVDKTSPDGNIALVFSGFDPNSLFAINTVQVASHRSAYLIYPRKLFNSWDGTIFTGGKTVLENRFDPDLPWLQARDVRTVVLISDGPDDSFNVNFADIPEPAEVEPGRTKSRGVR